MEKIRTGSKVGEYAIPGGGVLLRVGGFLMGWWLWWW